MCLLLKHTIKSIILLVAILIGGQPTKARMFYGGWDDEEECHIGVKRNCDTMGAQWGSGIGEKIIRNAKGRNGASHKLGLNLSIEEIDKL